METNENNDTWYFTILIIIVILTTGLISSWGKYNLFTSVKTDSDTYDKEIAEEKRYISAIDKIYKIASIDIKKSLFLVDSLLAVKWDSNYIKNRQWDLNYVKARVYYENNILDSALKYNAYSTSFYDRPFEKNLLLEIGCLVKKKDFDKAESIFNSAENLSADSKILKGTFYEFIKEKNKAIEVYKKIMENNSSYNFLNYNIDKVTKGKMSTTFSLPEDNSGRERWRVRPLLYRGKN